MTFALAAGDLFKLDAPGEFEETIISKCIDQYIAVSSARHRPSKQSKADVSLPALETTFAAGAADGSALIRPRPRSRSLPSRPSRFSRACQPTIPSSIPRSSLLPKKAGRARLSKHLTRRHSGPWSESSSVCSITA